MNECSLRRLHTSTMASASTGDGPRSTRSTCSSAAMRGSPVKHTDFPADTAQHDHACLPRTALLRKHRFRNACAAFRPCVIPSTSGVMLGPSGM